MTSLILIQEYLVISFRITLMTVIAMKTMDQPDNVTSVISRVLKN